MDEAEIVEIDRFLSHHLQAEAECFGDNELINMKLDRAIENGALEDRDSVSLVQIVRDVVLGFVAVGVVLLLLRPPSFWGSAREQQLPGTLDVSGQPEVADVSPTLAGRAAWTDEVYRAAIRDFEQRVETRIHEIYEREIAATLLTVETKAASLETEGAPVGEDGAKKAKHGRPRVPPLAVQPELQRDSDPKQEDPQSEPSMNSELASAVCRSADEVTLGLLEYQTQSQLVADCRDRGGSEKYCLNKWMK